MLHVENSLSLQSHTLQPFHHATQGWIGLASIAYGGRLPGRSGEHIGLSQNSKSVFDRSRKPGVIDFFQN